jgi:hypothetical protein
LGTIANIIDAIRRLGSPTQKSALARQDEFLAGASVIERRREVSRTESGTTASFVATVEPEPESVTPVPVEIEQAIRRNAAEALAFIRTYCPAVPTVWGLSDLDDAYAMWASSGDKIAYTDDAVVEILGAAYGEYCAARLDMRWVKVADRHGEAFAIQGKVQDFRSYPYHVIEKRLADSEVGFFAPIFVTLEAASRREWKPTDAA